MTRIAPGARLHYLDPVAYEHLYRRRRADVRFYVDLADRVGGPVLELGCGAGRVALPIARAGRAIVGLDASGPMLEHARARAAKLPARARTLVTFARGDLRTFRLDRRFPLIISPFNAVQHMYTRSDVEHLLERVRAHLEPSGLFVFDVLMPEPEFQHTRPGRRYARSPFTHPSTGTRYQYTESYSHDPVGQILHIQMFLDHPTNPRASIVMPVAHRQLYPLELEALLHYNAFRIVDRWGDFDRSPLGADSPSQIIACRVDRSHPLAHDRSPRRAGARRRRRS
ncbi:MAG: class I SAM-dependent methyltransferase [Deltaproteobacteria bacterium]|nr:class I SAM-dependent methyltransferase [Deltaproteobacteria bacterium]